MWSIPVSSYVLYDRGQLDVCNFDVLPVVFDKLAFIEVLTYPSEAQLSVTY